MSAHEQLARRPAAAPAGAGEAERRLQARLRNVNSEIARRAGSGVTAAFVCECLDRNCVEAVEAPLPLFAVLATAGNYFLVRPGHDEPAGERILRRDSGYVVVERTL
jgi:hypothetical protein